MATVRSNEYKGRYLELEVWEKSYNIAENTSLVGWKLSSIGGENNYYQIAPTTAIVDGVQVYYKDTTLWTDQVFPAAKGSVSGELTIKHDNEGKKTITFSLSTRVFVDVVPLTTSSTLVLTDLPRSSTAGATSALIGSVSSITVYKRNEGFTHSIQYRFGALSGYIAADGSLSSTEAVMSETGIAFTVPVSFYNQIPNSTSGICTLTVRTYTGDTYIGSTTAVFTASVDKSISTPVVSGTVEDTDTEALAVTGDKDTLVSGISDAFCQITAEARNGASIKTMRVNGYAITSEGLLIQNVLTNVFRFEVVDSRNYSTVLTVTKGWVPYLELTAIASVARIGETTGDARLQVAGNYYSGSFGTTENSLAVEYRINSGAWVAVEPVKDTSSYSVDTELAGLSYQNDYTIEVRVTDAVREITKSLFLRKGLPMFWWRNDGYHFLIPISAEAGFVGCRFEKAEEKPATKVRIRLENIQANSGREMAVRFRKKGRKKDWQNLTTYAQQGGVDNKSFPYWMSETISDIPITQTDISNGYVDVDLSTYLLPIVKPYRTSNVSNFSGAVDFIGRRNKPWRELKMDCIIVSGDATIGHSFNSIGISPQFKTMHEKPEALWEVTGGTNLMRVTGAAITNMWIKFY